MGVGDSPGGDGEAEVRREAPAPPCLGFSRSPEGRASAGSWEEWGLAEPSQPALTLLIPLGDNR